MLDRVLDEWLQAEARDEGGQRVRRNIVGDGQPVAEARLHDVEVQGQHFQLGLEGDGRRVRAIEGSPQEVAQAADHPVGLSGVLVNHRRDHVQGVEEEMGMDLALQDLEIGPGQLGLEPAGGALPLAVQAEIIPDPDHQRDRQGHDEIEVEMVQDRQLEVLHVKELRIGKPDDLIEAEVIEAEGESGFQGGYDEAGGDEDGDAPGPAALSEREPARDSDQGRGADDPGEPPDKIEKEVLPQRDPAVIEGQAAEIEMAVQEEHGRQDERPRQDQELPDTRSPRRHQYRPFFPARRRSCRAHIMTTGAKYQLARDPRSFGPRSKGNFDGDPGPALGPVPKAEDAVRPIEA